MKRKRCSSRVNPKQIIYISLLDESDTEEDTTVVDSVSPLPESVHLHLIRCILDDPTTTTTRSSSPKAPQIRLIQQFYQLKAWRDVCHTYRAYVHQQVIDILQSDFYRPKRQIGSLSIRESNRLLDIIPRHQDTETTMNIDATWSLYSTLIFYLELERHPIETRSPASPDSIIRATDELARYFVPGSGGGGGVLLQPLGTTPGLAVVRGLPVGNTTLKTEIKRYIASYDDDDSEERARVCTRLTKGSDTQRRARFYDALCELHAEATRNTASRADVARADAFPVSFRPLRPEEMTSEQCDYALCPSNLAFRVADNTYEFLLTSLHPNVVALRRSVVRTIGPTSRAHAQFAYNLRCHESAHDMRRETLIKQGEAM